VTGGDDRLARFDELVQRMPQVADAIAGFGESLRETAFWALVNIVDPTQPDSADVDVRGGGKEAGEVRALQAKLALVQSQKDLLAGQLDRLAGFLAERYPGGFPLSGSPVVDSAIHVLRERWTGPADVRLETWLAEHLPGCRRAGEDAVDTAIRVLNTNVLDVGRKSPDPRTVLPGMGCV
jgi:hypothetical protein